MSVEVVTLKRRWGKFNAGESCGVDLATKAMLLSNGYLDDRQPPEPDQIVDPAVEVINDSPEAKKRRDKRWYSDKMQRGRP